MSTIPSDLPGPVPAPTGPTQDVPEQPAIIAAVEESPGSIVGAPEVAVAPAVANAGEVLLAVEGPWYIKFFDPSLAGCPPIASSGTPVPAEIADQAISIGAANGVSIVKR